MASTGILRREHRLQGPGGRRFFLALDHGLPVGPLPGLEDPGRLVRDLRGAPLTGVIANPGVVRLLSWDAMPPLIVHLSAGTILGLRPTSKALASGPGRAFELGADAVSLQIHFGDASEDRMLADAGEAVDAAAALGLPSLVMAYPPAHRSGDPEAVGHAARAAAELGASIVQVPYTGSPQSFREVTRGSPAPVVVAGGPRVASPDAFLSVVEGSLEAGAAGLSAGRNLFQSPDPAGLARRIAALLFEGRLEPPVEAVSR